MKFTLAINPTTGQPDYSQQWIEYYRSIGQNDVADQIMQQMKEATKLFFKCLQPMRKTTDFRALKSIRVSLSGLR